VTRWIIGILAILMMAGGYYVQDLWMQGQLEIAKPYAWIPSDDAYNAAQQAMGVGLFSFLGALFLGKR